MNLNHTVIAGLALLALAAPSDRATAAQAAHTHTLRVATDNAEVVTVAGTPAVVLVANPQIADVVVEQGHLIFVIGKRPGQTRLYVYGAGGNAMLERQVVVVPQNDNAVTVVRDTASTDYSCDPRCVPVAHTAPANGIASTAPVAPAAAAPALPASPAAPATPTGSAPRMASAEAPAE